MSWHLSSEVCESSFDTMTFNINRSIDPWLDRMITDDKNACRKVQRMLEKENDLDSEVKYGTEQFVDAQPEVMEARVGDGHYSKHNVDRRAKRKPKQSNCNKD